MGKTGRKRTCQGKPGAIIMPDATPKLEPPETHVVVCFLAPRGLMKAALAEHRRRGVGVVEDVLLEWCETGMDQAGIEPEAKGG
jgi:hypothetical protein